MGKESLSRNNDWTYKTQKEDPDLGLLFEGIQAYNTKVKPVHINTLWL